MKSEVKVLRADKNSLEKSNQMIALLMTLFLLVLGGLSLTVLINSPA